MLHKRKREDTEKSERQYKRIHIAELIQEYEENEDNNITFDAFNLSDTEEELEDTSIINGNNIELLIPLKILIIMIFLIPNNGLK
jgi:hypothetical protein